MVVRMLISLLLILQPASLSAGLLRGAPSEACPPTSCCQVLVITTCCSDEIALPQPTASDDCTCTVRQQEQPQKPAPRSQTSSNALFIEILLRARTGVVASVPGENLLTTSTIESSSKADSHRRARSRLGVWRI